MLWKVPPAVKVYEALGALGDERVEIEQDGKRAKVHSSSRKKYYTVTYDDTKNAIMTNDNGSYWQGYLGYPAIAFLMKIGVLTYAKEHAEFLAGIAWKDINTKHKNDFPKTIQEVEETIRTKGGDIATLRTDVNSILLQIEVLHLVHLGKKIAPPQGY